VSAPYAYQNGKLNLINAVSLAGDPDRALERASPYMIEGEMLADASFVTERRLVMVGHAVDNQDEAFLELLQEKMERHRVRFLTINKLELLVPEIRQAHAEHS
jgi:hypothetical protein